MKVAIYPKIIDKKESTLILGSFESIHNGHLQLIKKAKTFKKSISMMIINDPSKLPGNSKINYAPTEIRLQNLAKLDVAKVSVINFDDNIRLINGKEFIENLVKITNAKKIVMGFDFACGINRSYKAKDIAKDFDSEIISEFKINNKKIGTSLLKEMVQTGEVNLIKKVSPFPYSMITNISEKLEIKFDDVLKPHPGIYLTTLIYNEIIYWGYTHVGMINYAKLFFKDLRVKNKQINARLEFQKLSRIIISSSNDKLLESDISRIEEYFNA